MSVNACVRCKFQINDIMRYVPWFFKRPWCCISHLLTYLLTYVICDIMRCVFITNNSLKVYFGLHLNTLCFIIHTWFIRFFPQNPSIPSQPSSLCTNDGPIWHKQDTKATWMSLRSCIWANSIHASTSSGNCSVTFFKCCYNQTCYDNL